MKENYRAVQRMSVPAILMLHLVMSCHAKRGGVETGQAADQLVEEFEPELLLVSTIDGRLYALDKADGSLVWSTDTGMYGMIIHRHTHAQSHTRTERGWGGGPCQRI